MERNEMVKILMEKAHVTEGEAYEALEKNNWDMLDSIVYLERIGKVENNDATAIIEVTVEDDKKEKKSNEEKYGGIGTIIGRIFRTIGRALKIGNKSFFEVRKENEKTIRLSVLIAALLLIFLTPLVVILLIVGLFSGYKYSIVSCNGNNYGANDIFEKASKSAENIKREFKEGYHS